MSTRLFEDKWLCYHCNFNCCFFLIWLSWLDLKCNNNMLFSWLFSAKIGFFFGFKKYSVEHGKHLIRVFRNIKTDIMNQVLRKTLIYIRMPIPAVHFLSFLCQYKWKEMQCWSWRKTRENRSQNSRVQSWGKT